MDRELINNPHDAAAMIKANPTKGAKSNTYQKTFLSKKET